MASALLSEAPRELNIVDFVGGRVDEVAELLDVIDNDNLPVGEVTQGPRTALQRLPRHMRRRAMSHNVKRLPRIRRSLALFDIGRTNHRNKTPSRFHRRRPGRLLQAYIRRQRCHVWLETHIWHAKRFRMLHLWGYRLADRSYQRAYRAAHRAAIRHCLIQVS